MVIPVKFQPKATSTPGFPRRSSRHETPQPIPSSSRQTNVSHSPARSEMSARVRNKKRAVIRRIDPETANRMNSAVRTPVVHANIRHTPAAVPPSTTPKHRSKRLPNFLREIRHYQKSTSLLISKLPFARVVRALTYNVMGEAANEIRWQAVCFLALQEAAEAFIVSMLEAAHRCAVHAKRVTVMPKDIQLVAYLQDIPTPQTSLAYRHI